MLAEGLAWGWFCSWAHCAQFFIVIKVDIARYSVFTCKISSYMKEDMGKSRWIEMNLDDIPN